MDHFSFAWNTIKKNPGAWILAHLAYVLVPFGTLLFAVNYCRMVHNAVQNDQAPQLSDLFNTDNLGNDIVTVLVVGLVGFVAALLCVLPALYILPILVFVNFLAAENKITGVDAVKACFAWGKSQWVHCVVTMIVIQFMCSLTIYACGAGLLVITAFMHLAQYNWFMQHREDVYAAAAAEGIGA